MRDTPTSSTELNHCVQQLPYSWKSWQPHSRATEQEKWDLCCAQVPACFHKAESSLALAEGGMLNAFSRQMSRLNRRMMPSKEQSERTVITRDIPSFSWEKGEDFSSASSSQGQGAPWGREREGVQGPLS